MRYLANNTNLVRESVLTGTNGVASSAIYRTDTAAKSGGGQVGLTGPYTGADDTNIDIEIVDNDGATTQVSQPLFTGIGNGAMSTVSATDVDPQTITVTLEDLGTASLSAYASFQGASLKAAAPGADGNLIAVDVDHSGLVFGDTDWSLQDDLQEGSNEYAGDHWDFGASMLEPGGTVPASAPRLSFGNDPQVYRQFKRYRDGRYYFSFSPAPLRDVPRGTRVHAVTGTRSVKITNGTDNEVFSGLVTLYDALSAIRAGSELVVVNGLVVNDRMPDGQGIAELSVRTRSYVLSVSTTDSGPITRAELDIVAQDTAPTETLTIQCADASIPGAEKWDVFGDVSGRMSRATTGLRYADGRYVLTIPLAQLVAGAAGGQITIEYLPEGQHGEEESIPAFCPMFPRIGSAAHDGAWDFIYVRRPPEECDCNDGDYQGAPNDACLGTTPEGGAVSNASVMVRLQRITSVVASLSVENTLPPSGAPSTTVGYNDRTLALLTSSAGILIDALEKIVGGTTAWPAWSATAVVAKDEIREPATPNGYRYAATQAGTTGTSEPTWPTTIGDTVTGDGGVNWVCLSKTPFEAFDTAYAQWLDDVDYFETASELVSDADIDQYNNRYRNLMADVLATAEISPNFHDASVDGDGCWQDRDDTYWWVSDGAEPPYMPLFTGYYNYSIKRAFDAQGRPYYFSTREWGFGIKVGCAENLKEGDRLRVTITGASGSGSAYQAGDAFSVRVNQANPLPLGGGQTGDDTLTWSVRASDDGPLPNYALVTTAPTAYSESIGAGSLGFAITPGGIPFALGDRFVFDIEGGRFRWRRDGGDWSLPIDIADTALEDGLVATFAGGAAPSWVGGDRWSFRAEATHGIEQVRRPVDGEFEWTGSTVISIADGGAIAEVLIAGHGIPADATIRLQGSDDGFATTPLDLPMTWRADCLHGAVEADYDAYRITVDRGGRIRWLYLGPGLQCETPNGSNELGRLTKRVRLPSIARRRAMGATVTHQFLAGASGDALLDALGHACEVDDSLLGIVPNGAEAECGMVRVDGDTIEVDDVLGFQPRDTARRALAITAQLEAVA